LNWRSWGDCSLQRHSRRLADIRDARLDCLFQFLTGQRSRILLRLLDGLDHPFEQARDGLRDRFRAGGFGLLAEKLLDRSNHLGAGTALEIAELFLQLTWPDILWDQDRFRVHSPKTRHQGKGERLVPLFPELRPFLEEAFELAEPGALYVVTRYRDTKQNLRTQLMRIIRRAGLVPWPRLFQNLRASRETELAELFPLRVVTDWLGNSPRVAHDHYLSTTEEHFRRAATSGAMSLQNRVQQAAAPDGTDSPQLPQDLAEHDVARQGANEFYLGHDKEMTLTGFEPVSQP